jgi:succinate dehydrogenase / fumarate reductase cytochrome b subunit
MPTFLKAAQSQVGRKILTGLTGILLTLFTIVHLLGNLSLYDGGEAFNIYADKLMSLGPLIYLAEAGLAVLFIVHAWIGISIYLKKRKARPIGYDKYETKGGPSHQSSSSTTMAITGTIILLFVILHIIHFKFGAMYEVVVDGENIRDLKRLVVEEFQKPLISGLYVAVMALLGWHLRHGIWSAFTSLTLKGKAYSKMAKSVGVVLAALLSIGFLLLPVMVYIGVIN